MSLKKSENRISLSPANLKSDVASFKPAKLIKHCFGKLLKVIQNLTLYRKTLRKIVHPKIIYKTEKRKKSFWFKAVYKENEIGSVVLIYRKDNGWELSSLNIKILFRGFGIGEKLSKDLLKFARENDIHKVYLRVSYYKRAAICLYEKLGFVFQKRLNNELFMDKFL